MSKHKKILSLTNIRKFLIWTLAILMLIFFLKITIKTYQFLKIAQHKQPTSRIQEPLSKKIQAYYYKIQPTHDSIYWFLRKAYYIFGIPKKGIIHIGARYAEELKIYKNHDIENILWIEADPEAEIKLKQATRNHPGSKVAMFAATDLKGPVTLRKTSNDGHSSSILKLKNHLLHYPSIVETKTFEVSGYRLDEYLSQKEQSKYNVLVLDVQGAELIALRGATGMLNNVDAIIAETNYDELYDNAVLIKDLDAFLAKHKFTRVESSSAGFYTGDALYVQDKFFKPTLEN